MMQINPISNKPHIFPFKAKKNRMLLSCSLIFFFLLASHPDYPPSLSELMLNQAVQHIGKPYLDHPLDAKREESLVTRMDSFDCVTFIEDVLSKSLGAFVGHPDMSDSFLLTLRYREGRIAGYESRIHYISEWLMQAEKNGYGKNISELLQGKTRQKKINFMSEHLSMYPKLHSKKILDAIRNSEANLSKMPVTYIPKPMVKNIENQLLPGDILAFTTNVPGLDIIHTAIIFKVNSHAQMIHASSKNKKIEVSELSVHRWMDENKNCDGLIVFRPECRLSM